MTIRPSVNIGSSSFSDLVYADDTAFFVKDAADATESSNPADLMESFTYLGSIQTSDVTSNWSRVFGNVVTQ